MPISVKNLDFIRQYQEIGTKLAEALQQIADAHNQVEQQGNFNSTGQPKAPPPVQGLMVQASNGHFQVAIDHNVDRYRGVNYFVEHADNPNFTDSHTEEMGASRNANLFLGDSTRYFRAYAAYPGSAPGDPAYHGHSRNQCQCPAVEVFRALLSFLLVGVALVYQGRA